MRYALIALSLLMGAATPAMAQVSVTVSIPGVSIGINQPVYPELVLVPGYPVYYAPRAQVNYFFYDGLYWVYQDDRWYASSWYNGPWDYVEPDDVPLFVLRVPVRYYVYPPVYFRGWVVTAPPRWDLYWGPRWVQHRHGWDHWDRHAIPAPAPLPVYQRQYYGDRYPRPEYQRVIRTEHYRYQPRDNIVRRHDEPRAAPRPEVHAQSAPQNPPQQHGPYSRNEQQPQRGRDESRRPEAMQVLPAQRAPVVQEQRPQPRQEPERRVQSAPREREEARRPEGMQALPQQRATVMQERQQQQERQERAPRPQQVQDRGSQDRGERHQSRDNPGRPERGGERGPGRG